MKKGLIFLPVVIGLCVMVVLPCVVVYAQSSMCKDGGPSGNDRVTDEYKNGVKVPSYTPKGASYHPRGNWECTDLKKVCDDRTETKPSQPSVGDTYEISRALIVGMGCKECKKGSCNKCRTVRSDGKTEYGETLVACEYVTIYTYTILRYWRTKNFYDYTHSKNGGADCY